MLTRLSHNATALGGLSRDTCPKKIGNLENAHPAELWKCPACGRRALVRDEEEEERPSYVYEPSGSA